MQRLSTFATVEIDLNELTQPNGGKHAVGSVVSGYQWCQQLASSHYENFPVASILVPQHLRKHIAAIYSLARLGDDIADEAWLGATQQQRLRALEFLDRAVDLQVDVTGHPVLTAALHTIVEFNLPNDCFHRLFEAFRRDVVFEPPTHWDDLLEYCSFSANPVGELMLRLNGVSSQSAIDASNNICTALQITNFLQDQSVDNARGRNYLPVSAAEAIKNTRALFIQGASVALEPNLPARMRWELRAIIAAGYRMLQKCEAQVTELAVKRPALTTIDYVCIVVKLLSGRWKPMI